MHGLRLSNSMTPVLCLLVHRWVPVGIVEYHAVSTRQVDANATAPGRRDEAEDLLIQVEPVDELLPLLDLD